MATPLAGQIPAQRRSFDRLRDSLATITDTVLLRSRQASLRHLLEHQPDSIAAHLELGLVSLRAAQLGADPGASQAVRSLREVTERQPDWPYGWFALGLAEAQRAGWEQRDRRELGNRVGMKTLERATGRHRRALETDPAFAPAAAALAELTLGLRDTALLQPAQSALRRSAGKHAPPEVLLAWGRVERAAAEPDSAVAAFERFLVRGGSRAVGLLELARTRLAEGEAAGETAYYEGAALEDSAAVAGFRADLVPIAADSDLARFDAARGPERAELLRRFWTDRDRIELRPPGERLREHYRRLQYARRHFALTVSRRYYGAADAYRSGSTEIDDRGMIYVRQGEPSDRLRPFVFGLMPNESWRYTRADGDLLFHFSAGWDQHGGGDLYDYRLVESVLDLRGSADAPRDQLLLSRQSLSNLYPRMLNWGPYGAARSQARERGIGQVSVAYGTSTDSYELQFARRLGAVADLVAVGDAGGAPLAHLVFAVAGPLDAATGDAVGYRYPVRVRLATMDGAGRPFAVVDTVVLFHLARELGRGQYLIGRAELPLPAGRWTWRAALELGDSTGVVLTRDSVQVAPLSGGLSLSDLVLGAAEASARWGAAPGDTVLLTPFDLFRERAEVELYYEVRGAAAGTTYRHEIAVFRVDGGTGRAERRPQVTLGFEEAAGASVLRSHRTLQLRRLKPGRYLVEVRVTPPGSPTVTRQRGFRITRDD